MDEHTPLVHELTIASRNRGLQNKQDIKLSEGRLGRWTFASYGQWLSLTNIFLAMHTLFSGHLFPLCTQHSLNPV